MYKHPFRRYQALALDAFEKARAAGRSRCYVVMPPGAGKTALGLEIARRLGRRTVVFGPNTAIQAQWLRQAADFEPELPASSSPQLLSTVTVLTYQALCTFDHELDELAAADHTDLGAPAGDEDGGSARSNAMPDPSDANAEGRRRRRLILEGGDRAELLRLLHPHGRELFERIKAAGEIALVLDECHHLLETWGHLVEAIVDELSDRAFVVGLTATPPDDMDAPEAALYERLFGRADFEVPTPAVVKEGDLAPYQELAYLTEPLPNERDYIAGQERRFQELLLGVFDPSFTSRPLLDWLHARLYERRSPSGAQVTWPHLEVESPQLARAGLRVLLARGLVVPDGARVREEHRQPPTADDWAVLVGDYCRGYLRDSTDPRDIEAWDRIRRELPPVGYVLMREGVRSYVSPVDRVLALSAAKGVAVQTILDLERQQLGPHLRALVLCDFERAGILADHELRDVLDPQAGSAALVLELLAADAGTRSLDPMLLTGRTVACSRSTAIAFADWLGPLDATHAATIKSQALAPNHNGHGADPASASGWDDIAVLRSETAAWQPREYVPLVTRFFEEGGSRCLVGTRGLLGEGWDAQSVNVLVDLTAAGTSTSVHQMRGRSLRLDPDMPQKVADNWDVVCVAAGHPKGDADYRRFVRKHKAYYALTAAGEIERGVSHVDSVLSPFGPPQAADVPALNERTLARIGQRDDAYAAWKIGQPYRNVETDAVRLRFGRSIGLASRGILARRSRTGGMAGRAAIAVAAGVSTVLLTSAASVDAAVGLAAGGLVTVAGVGRVVLSGARSIRDIPAAGALEDLASAVAAALVDTGGIAADLDPSSIRLGIQADGYYRCFLDGASAADAAAFADALDELLAPIEDPRYIISRRVVDPPRTTWAAARIAITRGLLRGGGRTVWHAVPSYLAANKERVTRFEKAWHDCVGPGRVVFSRSPEGQGILEVTRGENPFATETQIRTLWS